MTNLTEQWNKGKLPEGDYYIKKRNSDLPYDNIDSHGIWRNTIDEDIIEVLAPVPSYDEWKKAYECVVSENEEITTLKELLNKIKTQCELIVPKNGLNPVGNKERLCKAFLNLIDEVLNER